MFTVLWKTPLGGEELFVAPYVALNPALPEPDDQAPCRGGKHVSFQRMDGYGLEQTFIDRGEVFVMNGGGNTVATYRF